MSNLFDPWDPEPADWLNGDGPSADIVIGTRARLARNLTGFSFPHHQSAAELETVFLELRKVLSACPGLSDGEFLSLAEIPDVQHQLLQEAHLASPALLRDPQFRGLMISRCHNLIGMVNEEDHLRLVALASGFAPETVSASVAELDAELEKVVGFAYRDDLGYLTTSPTNVGTGLRVSVLVHLPGLVLAEQIEKILNALRQLRFSVRGLAGPGSSVKGAVFQISNLVTLGREEEEIVNDFNFHVGKVLLHEKTAREQLYARDPLMLDDMAHRSLATVQSARMITSQETFDRLSHVRLGASLGILPSLAPELLNTALIGQQTAHLELSSGRPLQGKAKAEARASFLRGLFSG